MLCSNLLNDEYMTMLPKPTANEKKHCVTAAYHTCKQRKRVNSIRSFQISFYNSHLTLGSRILSHRGLIKKTIPFQAPSKVTARTNRMPMMTYGNKAKKYDALPELRMPRINTAAITNHATSKKNAKFNIGVPIPCLISFASLNTSLL